jgi:hypothetical protein
MRIMEQGDKMRMRKKIEKRGDIPELSTFP